MVITCDRPGNYTTVVAREKHYHWYLDTLDKGCSALLDVTVQEMCWFCNYCADEA